MIVSTGDAVPARGRAPRWPLNTAEGGELSVFDSKGLEEVLAAKLTANDPGLWWTPGDAGGRGGGARSAI